MSEKSNRARQEEKILKFWQDNKIFEKSLEKESPKGEFVFYEGPPTANGRPGIHHLEARAFKDAIPRYKTMQGFHVRRKAGWDTHGLPVELEVEKILGLESKKEIEKFGIGKFNEECKKNVWKYVDEWKNFSDRIGFWADMDHPYATYHNSYIEAVWSIMAEVEKRGLLYKDYKVVPWCPRCETALSSHELAQGYKDTKDLSVFVEFKLLGHPMSKGTSDVPTYLLAWTTAPWTLPGNIALAVGEEIDYVEIEKKDMGVGEKVKFILAKSRLKNVFGDDNYEITREMKGKDLVGLEYEPPYSFVKDVYQGEGMDKAYHVYPANFVTTEDGTGIVHTAAMYGIEDFEFGTKIGLPKYHLVDESGHFTTEAGFLAGKFVKNEETNVAILKDLAERNLFFAKEKYEHSYPFCWRCQTPLIYYARDSWYIAMSKLRDELVRENEQINWEPAYIKKGRFGEWLREVKDWAISRERYWGTPLPIWVTGQAPDQKMVVVDSVETLKKYAKTNKNQFWMIRHGEAQNNELNIVSSRKENKHHLSELGRKQSEKAAEMLRKNKIDLIVSSPFMRTKETAEIVRKTLNLPEEALIYDDRIGELKAGELEGKPEDALHDFFKTHNVFEEAIPGGESFQDIKKRLGKALEDLEKTYQDKNILLVTHRVCCWILPAAAWRLTPKESEELNFYIKNAEIAKLDEPVLPHNEDFELDLHKPYIDDVVLEKDGDEYRRVKEVMDVWFDSGAMPFAQDADQRSDLENSKRSDLGKMYPADFISEALDQTRGWFYTLHAIGVLMGKGAAYRNVICLGLLMDKEGKKMSKSVGNVVDPWEAIEKHGADALRLWMYSVNQPGDPKNYDDRSVEEINRRVFNMIDNVSVFFELYAGGKRSDLDANSKGLTLGSAEPAHILDKWILSCLNELIDLTTKKLDAYNLFDPARAIKGFVEDLSTWYLRRSRDRIKNGDKEAINTLGYVLKTFAKILAPLAPFAAEELYQKLRTKNDPESVHLCDWPSIQKGQTLSTDSQDLTLENMAETRRIASLALEQRQKANIKVRQPLQKLEVRSLKLEVEYLDLIKDEINVKEIVENSDIETEVNLDITLTPELELEGKMRDLVREIQDMRKEKGLKPGEKMFYHAREEDKPIFDKYSDEIIKMTDIEILSTKL